ncbi:UDP-N-acetylglucosamine 2-epimerase [Winogradskyella sp. UBA3174]|uniref:UDP-N-acetylglucosamine 2-epimerase n=1 Tax=Winogradskyella sp. UBA3174 TaxID=1947785 RepID=UPI0025E66F33|nr:UDP-N-acetylglucosamine 2-epimerase [Winogradskyella sp. UBA3174]|tara:strand:+ start:72562 stop:73695 length:1134 start_codon:yes stop_codon:yes gene_type:complete
MEHKKIIFLTGTRADFGKIKGLISILESKANFEPYLFVTGMHLLHEYGYTLLEVERCGYKYIHTFNNHTHESTMDLTLAKTIEGFSAYVKSTKPDLIVVHGDRVEALAGAIVGSLNNILVAHIEGGEISGTIDELIRHSVSKLSHIHYTSNDEAKKRLLQMGEVPESIYTIGSPDIDVMFSDALPGLDTVTNYYEIPFENYAVAMYHPVTTEVETIKGDAVQFVKALKKSNKNYIVVFPNNDLGSQAILEVYSTLKNNSNFRIFPSIRFEYFLTLLKHAEFIIGNSSAGIREAPYYGVPSINVGTRQQNRVSLSSVVNTECNVDTIVNAIDTIGSVKSEKMQIFGFGDSASLFLKSLESETLWSVNHQKQFKDIDEF